MKRDNAIAAYLQDARRWDDDRVASALRSKRHAYWVASSYGAIATLALLALVALLPLKSVQPFVIRVDNTSGIVDVVPVYVGKGEMDELVTRHLLHQYVLARERYAYAMAEQDYNIVGAYNTAPLNAKWSAEWDQANEKSPLNRYKDGTTVRAQVNAVSFIHRADGSKDLAQVRFITGTRAGGTGVEHVQHWISTIQYAYAEPSKDDQLRMLNPLGFRVLEYRRESEVVLEPPAPLPTAPGGSQ